MGVKISRTSDSSIAFAWCSIPPGTTKLSRLEENLGGATIELTVDEVQSLEQASSEIKVEGARYSPFHQSLVGR